MNNVLWGELETMCNSLFTIPSVPMTVH